ncbi:hypothetical protein [Mycobacterium sp. AZCC_0083]|uniref:hypothetical protein n=1 Tax=Mycobacterium sp. AZCC_0083 TaxID=2735882 RepID=UPI0016213011|nr:hypothetical protein [Mycobacterium sp. AZCC_0083]MBB5164881.1 hypothetical protein [Mycobacterium sp. AZCC_0083]
MARSKLLTIAGAGTVAAFLLVGGAAIPVVSADPGHSHGGNNSQRGGNSREGDRDFRDRDGQRGGQGRDDDGGWQRDDDPVGSGGTTGPNRWNDPSSLKPSDGANRTGTLKPNQSGETTRTGTTTSRSEAVTTPPVTVVESPVTARRAAGVATPATLAPIPAVPAVPARPVSGGGGASPVTATPPVTPTAVTVGNGRSPGILTGRPERAPRSTGTTPNVAPAVTQPAATHLPPTDRLDVAPAERMVASLWAAAAPGQPGGLLFGLAGLFLAPIAGAWLGYRQARASRAAAQLIRH